MAARAQIIVEQSVVAICVGFLRRRQGTTLLLALDGRLHATALETLHFAEDGLARLPSRQRFCTRIAVAARRTATACEHASRHTDYAETNKKPHPPIPLFVQHWIDLILTGPVFPKAIVEHSRKGFATPEGLSVATSPHGNNRRAVVPRKLSWSSAGMLQDVSRQGVSGQITAFWWVPVRRALRRSE